MDTPDFRIPAPPALSTPIDSMDYNMCHEYRGICLIFDNENFAPKGITRNLQQRVGSHLDSEAIANLFTKLGFDVCIRKDLTAASIKETLKQVALYDHSTNDCFVCFVLTHGDQGNLYAYDGRYAINHLFTSFLGDKCPTLVGKPKLFFIQACQGNLLDPGVVVSVDALDSACYFKIPTYADFMVAYSTLAGFYSFRNTQKGSWFINALVQVIGDYHMELDLMSMMTIVSHRVAYCFSSSGKTPEFDGMKQVPCITSMLTRRVYFFPKSITL